jgi:hypothetical protein
LLEPDEPQPAGLEAAQERTDEPALHAIWLDDYQGALHCHMPEGYPKALF